VAKPLVLTPNEKLLFDELRNGIDQLHDSEIADPEIILKELAPKACELHMSLKIHGHEPIYNSFILKNREVSTTETAFFDHIHPIEDLLSFIQNPEANDGQAGANFVFPVYVSGRRRYIDYDVICTQSGWMTGTGEDRRCEQLEALGRLNVSYPNTVGTMLEETRKAALEGITRQEIQDALNAIAQWISKCEKTKPHMRVL